MVCVKSENYALWVTVRPIGSMRRGKAKQLTSVFHHLPSVKPKRSWLSGYFLQYLYDFLFTQPGQSVSPRLQFPLIRSMHRTEAVTFHKDQTHRCQSWTFNYQKQSFAKIRPTGVKFGLSRQSFANMKKGAWLTHSLSAGH